MKPHPFQPFTSYLVGDPRPRHSDWCAHIDVPLMDLKDVTDNDEIMSHFCQRLEPDPIHRVAQEGTPVMKKHVFKPARPDGERGEEDWCNYTEAEHPTVDDLCRMPARNPVHQIAQTESQTDV